MPQCQLNSASLASLYQSLQNKDGLSSVIRMYFSGQTLLDYLISASEKRQLCASTITMSRLKELKWTARFKLPIQERTGHRSCSSIVTIRPTVVLRWK